MKISTTGKMSKGQFPGWFVRVEEDLDVTGGYYVYYSSSLDFGSDAEGYDDWYLTLTHVEQCVEDLGVEWIG